MKLPLAGGRYFVRLTCCLLVIATIPPLVLGAILFGNARQNMSRQMALFSQNYLGQTLNAMEVVFSQIEDSGRQTILDSSFKTFETFTDGKGMEKLISSLEVGENLRGTARYLEAKARMLEQLRSFELTNAFIDSIYFCDSGKGLVYSSAGLQYGMADFFDPNATTGILPGMTEEQIIEELNRIVEEGMFNISINTQISFPNGTAEGQAYIDNISANHYNMTVQIVLDDTGESVYQSGGIRPGQYIENITLSKALPKGSYKATAIFTAHDPEDQSEVGQAAAEVLLTVES